MSGLFPFLSPTVTRRRVAPRHWMTVDPGLQGTGYAVWRFYELKETGVITSKAKEWWERAYSIAGTLYLRGSFSEIVYVEHMEYFGGSKNLAWKTGDLQRTTYLEGCIAGRFNEANIVVPIPVREWKGQLPKAVVIRRIQKELGKEVCEDLGIVTHAWDAVGIGLWAQNRL